MAATARLALPGRAPPRFRVKEPSGREPDFTTSAGPSPSSARTRAALGRPVPDDHDPVFLDAFRRTEAKVGRVFGTGNEIILMQGEAILGALAVLSEAAAV